MISARAAGSVFRQAESGPLLGPGDPQNRHWAARKTGTRRPAKRVVCRSEAADAAHLIWLREQTPGVRAGLILHTGPRAYQLHDDVAAIPISSLWH
jgi:hypothetical protein